MLQIINNTQLTMSSYEIAELAGKRHDNVMRDIRSIEVELGALISEDSSYLSEQAKEIPMLLLDKESTLLVVSGYSVVLRQKIIRRWIELEDAQPKVPNFANPAEAAIAWAHQYTLAQEAIRTKAEIGSKREATAMATASVAVKHSNKLEIEMDKHQAWASVLRVEQVTGKKYSWKPLKDYCVANNLEVKKVNSGMDTRFAQVNTYPAESWAECYLVDITEFKS